METYNIRHLVGIKASAETVYQALTDTKKLAGWWTADTRGKGSTVGDVLEFWFEDFCLKFEVADLQQGKLVRWKYDGKDEEWAGTEVAFSLNDDEEQCYVNFSHTGWRSDSGCFSHCSTKWAVFMLSLKDLLEKGKGQPAPDDVKIEYDEVARRRLAA
ncbi:MAG: SRPBCC domain-containing protein [Syntrophobacteraceae bacterium]|nr:SRPBCC domain-containing protein [Syntrophobacteraceae bacterium]